jgi:cation:H+ antiporter
MGLDLALVAVGLLALVAGGETLVRGAVALATRAGLSPMVIGLTLVGFGTSTPELVTSLQAARAGSDGIALGNVVGSNIGNILLILGLAAAFAPVAVDPAAFRRDGAVLIAASVLLTALVAMNGGLDRTAGWIFVGLLAAYLGGTLWQETRRPTPAAHVYEGEAATHPAPGDSVGLAAGLVVFGLAATIFGAGWLVDGAIGIASAAGVPEAVIGLTVVAIGTSLPELATTVVAVRKGETDVALGNVVGSNIFNIFGILGITAIVSPLTAPAQIARVDIWVMLAATLLLLVVARTGWRVGRAEGAAMILAYAVYIGALALLSA